MAFNTQPPWFANGTVTTNGTNKVIGLNTSWTDVASIALGDMLTIDGLSFYQIIGIGDGTLNGDGTAGTQAGTQAGNNTIIQVDRTIPTGATQAYAILQLAQVNPINSDIAFKVSAMVQSWQGREDELIAWLGGTSGTFNLTDAVGKTTQVKCPAQMQADVDQTILTVIGAKNTLDSAVALSAKAATDRAILAQVAANDSAILAESAWTAALSANPSLNPQVHMNPSVVTTDLSIPDYYNAYASGPLEVAVGVQINVGLNANLNII